MRDGDLSEHVERPNLAGLVGGATIPRERGMTEGKRFAQLLKEFERVGVDPNTISAGLAVREEDVLRALHALPDNAGPAAFLTQLRLVMTHTTSHGPGRV